MKWTRRLLLWCLRAPGYRWDYSSLAESSSGHWQRQWAGLVFRWAQLAKIRGHSLELVECTLNMVNMVQRYYNWAQTFGEQSCVTIEQVTSKEPSVAKFVIALNQLNSVAFTETEFVRATSMKVIYTIVSSREWPGPSWAVAAWTYG